MLNHQDYNSLKEIIDLRRVGKFMPSFDYKNIFSLDKLNYNLNYQNLIYPYLRVNNGLVSNENAKYKRLRLRGLLGSLHRVMIKDYYSKPRLPPKTKTHYFGGSIREMLKTSGGEKRKALLLVSEKIIKDEEAPLVVS